MKSLTLKGSLLAVLLSFSLLATAPEVKRTIKRDSKSRVCLIEAVWHEALNQPKKGQQAVLDVIKNRKDSKGFPNSFCEVVHQPKAFSYRNHLAQGKRASVKLKTALDAKTLKDVENLVDFFLHGEYKPILSHRVLWYTRNEVQTVWMKSMKVNARIADHKFLEMKG